jgi:hypothetical protein
MFPMAECFGTRGDGYWLGSAKKEARRQIASRLASIRKQAYGSTIDSHTDWVQIMFKPRRIETASDWLDADGVKLYTVSASGKDVRYSEYLPKLQEIKALKGLDWSSTPSFAIFHEGISADYLVLAWWGNDNELFTSVSVREGGAWFQDSSNYSFCVWDLEILWAERNIFVSTMYSGRPDLQAYRHERFRSD